MLKGFIKIAGIIIAISLVGYIIYKFPIESLILGGTIAILYIGKQFMQQ